ncbi:hypothetical protein [Halomonas elongata]|uniref:hypothetical protein n=1 Tax=Halomonas elongata TaxID=2746 RepID=UPI0023AEAE29|nr:hypothetical protein [Halomonas elongata]
MICLYGAHGCGIFQHFLTRIHRTAGEPSEAANIGAQCSDSSGGVGREPVYK